MPFPPDGPSLPASHSEAALPLRGVTVLVVEDSRVTCDALRLIFQRTGARLRRAETLVSARRHLDAYRPDVVIVDLGLPDGRGEALIALAAADGLPVLALSGDPDGRAPAMDAGAIAFVEKQEIAAPPADPLALRDDLAFAAALVLGPATDYATGFVRSLARAAGDQDLEVAALQAGTESGRAALAALLTARLTALYPVN